MSCYIFGQNHGSENSSMFPGASMQIYVQTKKLGLPETRIPRSTSMESYILAMQSCKACI